MQVRAHGNYAFKIENPLVFLTNIVGTKSRYRLEDITEQLRGFIVNQFTDIIGSLNLTVTQIASNYNEIAAALSETLGEPFAKLGLSVTHFTIGNIGLPEEIEKHLKELTGMNILGSVQNDKLSKIQILKQLEIMSKSTENDGLNAMMQNGMGLGMGLHMGNAFAGGLNQMTASQVAAQQMAQSTVVNTPNSNQQAVAAGDLMPCGNCQSMIKKTSKFCPECGQKVTVVEKKKFCTECGTPAEPGVKFCVECGTKLGE